MLRRSRRRSSALGSLLLVLIGACSQAPLPASPRAAAPRYPDTPLHDVDDVYHGVHVADPYQWLEAGASPEVKRWTDAQTHHARSVLDHLPDAMALRKRITELKTSRSPDFFSFGRRGATQLALSSKPAQQQATLVVLPSLDDPKAARVLVDPNALDATGATTIDFYALSVDGKKVAVSLSRAGTERGDVHVVDTETGRVLADVVPHVNGPTAGGSVTWNKDGSGFFYTRYPKAGERAEADLDFYQQIYFHALGTPEASDRYVLGKDFPRIAEVALTTSDDGGHVLAQVALGDGGQFAHYLLDASGPVTQLTHFEDSVTDARFGRDGRIYLLSTNGAPKGKLLRLPAGRLELASAEVIVPESDGTIESFTVAASRLYVVDLLGGPSRIRVFDLAGHRQPEVPLPPVSSVAQIARVSGDEVLVRSQTFIDPPAWYRFPGTGAVTKTAFVKVSSADFGDAEVVRETCTSRDGTQVPLNVIRKKGARLDGHGPALLYGYGGYGISLEPVFEEDARLWLDVGGTYAIANLRGGSELGEAWHRGGNLLNKQNVFDDFAACAKHLVEAGYTRPEKLAILGGSNGGLLMGAMITQHPELFHAAVSKVGIYDMLRVELSSNGAFNVTEYGSVKDPAQFEALYAYSPYHHVKGGAAYPAVLLTTGENDTRVDPWQSRKMAARLQAATSSSAPVLLVTRSDAGHGVGRPLGEEIDQAVDDDAFLFHELGVAYPVK